MSEIETINHTERYIKKLHDLGGMPLADLASALYVALHSEHDLVIRLHERLIEARRTIDLLRSEGKGD